MNELEDEQKFDDELIKEPEQELESNLETNLGVDLEIDSDDVANEEKSTEKQERFKKIAESRTVKILKTLKLLGNCSNKGNYEYSEEDITKIFSAIEMELENTKKKFHATEADEVEFKL